MVVEGNEQNLPGGSTPKHRSSFPESYREFTTMRFADITPSYIADTVESGHYPLRSVSDVRSPSLKAPLMENISMKKFYAHVPKQCILPFNWDKIEVNPNQGDDVDFSKVGTSVANFPYKVAGLLKHFAGLVDSAVSTSPAAILQAMFRFLCLSQYFHSNGSLFAHLRMNLAKYGWYSFHYDDDSGDYFLTADADKFFDYWYLALVSTVKDFIVSDSDGKRYRVFVDEDYYLSSQSIIRSGDIIHITFRMFWEMFMDAPFDYTVSSVVTIPNRSVDLIIRDLTDDSTFAGIVQGYDTQMTIETVPIDLGRLWAYQIACVQFFSNDHVDYIYNAELFRQNIGSILDSVSVGNSGFVYNGITTLYDYLSAFYTDVFLDPTSVSVDSLLKYWCNLCSFRKSLRYMDYFTGARTRPLAMGDVDVDVNNNVVSVIDITKNIQIQKFLNAVNRSGRRLSNYVKELFGTNIGYDFHEPEYLAQTKDVVFGSEVENTADAQQDQAFSVTSVLRGKSSNFEFSFDCKRPGYLIGVTFFDIPRAYTRSIDRQVFAVDRFDLFNPYLQFIGDQQIYRAELGLGGLSAFGYKDRYNEYKERYNVASGGFVDNLPGFAFLADSYTDEVVTNRPNISPSYIRSRSYELDRFYIRLTGFNWSNYFHFVVRNDNISTPTLPMVKHPTIL